MANSEAELARGSLRRKLVGVLCAPLVLAAASLAMLGLLHAPEVRAQTAASPYTSGFRWDDMRRLVGTISPSKAIDGSAGGPFLAQRYTYDPDGKLTRVEIGRLAAWQSDTVQPKNWAGFTLDTRTDFSYDAVGNKVLEVLSDGTTNFSVTQYAYDADGQLVCTAVRMNSSNFGTPAALGPVKTKDACLLDDLGSHGPDRITRSIYDPAGRVVQIRKAVGTPLELAYQTATYTPNGKQEFLIEATGSRAQYVYDGFDRLSQWTFPSALVPPSYLWKPEAAAGYTDPIGSQDWLNDIVASSATANSSDRENYKYDANGNRTQLRKRDGSIINYTYDRLDRLTCREIFSTGLSAAASPKTEDLSRAGCIWKPTTPVADSEQDVAFIYDLLGRQTDARFYTPTGEGVHNAFDAAGRLTSTSLTMDGATRIVGYEYDANGNRTKLTYPDASVVTYEFDGLDRPTAIKRSGTGSTTIAAYGYYADGRRSTMNGGINTSYTYDGAGRMATLTNTPAPTGTTYGNTYAFTYNPASQIATRATSNDAFVWTQAAAGNSSFIANGLNCYRKVGGLTNTCDRNGNLITDSFDNWKYDVENRLVDSVPLDPRRIFLRHDTTVRYDPLGRLYEVVTYADAGVGKPPRSTPPLSTTRFLYGGDELLGEFNGSGQMTARYVHGADGKSDDPVAWYSGVGAPFAAANERILRPNWQGSISLVTDRSGALIATNTYDEYGIRGQSSANDPRFQYTGQVYLPELGVYYYKARMYSAVHGRFMQTDPIGYKDQFNLYAYVANDPMNRSDPTGLESQVICRSVYGAGNHCFVVITNDKKQVTARFSYGPEKVSCALCDKGKLVETKGDRDSPTNRSDATAARTGEGVTARTSLNQFGVTDDQVRKAGQAMDAQLGSTGKPGNTDYSLLNSSSNTAAAGVLDKAQPGLSGKVELGAGVTPGWPNGGAPKPNPALDQYLKCVNSGGCK